MIPRASPLRGRPRLEPQPSTIRLAALVLALALSLQGCGNTKPEPKKEADGDVISLTDDDASQGDNDFKATEQQLNGSKPEQVTQASSKPGKAKLQGDSYDMSWCDREVTGKQSQIYMDQLKEDAPAYYTAVEKVFGENFIKYPFCLQMKTFVVNVLDKEMTGDPAYQGLTEDKREEMMNETVKDLYFKHEKTWMSMCRDWSEHNKQHQQYNLGMVRTVLGLQDVSEADLKEQIGQYYSWQPWWTFFSEVLKKGCVRRYTDQCFEEVKAARESMKEVVEKKTRDGKLRWMAFEDDLKEDDGNGNPGEKGKSDSDSAAAESFIQESKAKQEASETGQVYIDNDDTHWKSLSQARQHLRQQQMVPVELRPGGQQLRPRRSKSQH